MRPAARRCGVACRGVGRVDGVEDVFGVVERSSWEPDWQVDRLDWPGLRSARSTLKDDVGRWSEGSDGAEREEVRPELRAVVDGPLVQFFVGLCKTQAKQSAQSFPAFRIE